MSEVTAAGGAGSPVTPEERADELPAIVKKCGFNWPDDEAGRWRVLGLVAGTVAYWRKQCDECLSGVMRESRYQHLERRLLAYIRKCRNIRKAAIEYKAGRDFDQFAALRTENERLTAAIRAAEADAAAREREKVEAAGTAARGKGLLQACDTLANEWNLIANTPEWRAMTQHIQRIHTMLRKAANELIEAAENP